MFERYNSLLPAGNNSDSFVSNKTANEIRVWDEKEGKIVDEKDSSFDVVCGELHTIMGHMENLESRLVDLIKKRDSLDDGASIEKIYYGSVVKELGLVGSDTIHSEERDTKESASTYDKILQANVSERLSMQKNLEITGAKDKESIGKFSQVGCRVGEIEDAKTRDDGPHSVQISDSNRNGHGAGCISDDGKSTSGGDAENNSTVGNLKDLKSFFESFLPGKSSLRKGGTQNIKHKLSVAQFPNSYSSDNSSSNKFVYSTSDSVSSEKCLLLSAEGQFSSTSCTHSITSHDKVFTNNARDRGISALEESPLESSQNYSCRRYENDSISSFRLDENFHSIQQREESRAPCCNLLEGLHVVNNPGGSFPGQPLHCAVPLRSYTSLEGTQRVIPRSSIVPSMSVGMNRHSSRNLSNDEDFIFNMKRFYERRSFFPKSYSSDVSLPSRVEQHPLEVTLSNDNCSCISDSTWATELSDYRARISKYEQLIDRCQKAAEQCYDVDNFADAGRVYEKMLSLQGLIYGPDSPESIQTLDLVGLCHYKNQKWEDALSTYNKRLDSIKSALGHKHIHAACTLYHIGDIYLKLQKYKEALKPFNEASKIYAANGYNDLSTNAQSCFNEAVFQMQEGS